MDVFEPHWRMLDVYVGLSVDRGVAVSSAHPPMPANGPVSFANKHELTRFQGLISLTKAVARSG